MDQTSAVSQGPSVQNILSHALQPEHTDLYLIITAYINKTKGCKNTVLPTCTATWLFSTLTSGLPSLFLFVFYSCFHNTWFGNHWSRLLFPGNRTSHSSSLHLTVFFGKVKETSWNDDDSPSCLPRILQSFAKFLIKRQIIYSIIY